MGTPSNIIWHGISKLCAQFHAFITLVTIRSLSHLTNRLINIKPDTFVRYSVEKKDTQASATTALKRDQVNLHTKFINRE